MKMKEWTQISNRKPNKKEYEKNAGLFIVSDGNRSYFAWYDSYHEQFGKPVITCGFKDGFSIDHAVVEWMPLPEPSKKK